MTQNKLNLSEIYTNKFNLVELLWYMNYNNKTTLVNDLCPKPYVEYDIEDLKEVWNDLKDCL